MASKTLHFDNDEGHRLAALLDMPADDAPVGYALFAHCFTCSKDSAAAQRISRSMQEAGFGVLRFDFAGLGESEGDFAETGFSSNVADLVAAARFMDEALDAPVVLVGHSLGGAAVLRAAAQIPSARAVATLAAPADPEHATRLLADAMEEIEAEGAAQVELGGRSLTITKQFLDDLRAHPMEDVIASLDRALLVLHSPVDQTVGIEHATRIFTAAKHPKSFVSLDEADHLLTDPDDAAYAGHVLAAWATRYLDASGGEEKTAAEGEHRVVVRTARGGLRTEVLANGHPLVADEPRSVEGGTNQGPTPYDYLGVALGACTSMTLRMYADRKGWPLEEAVVRVAHAKAHAEDCAHCEDSSSRLDHFRREVELTGDLDEEQRRRLLEIANRCPVHRTFHSTIMVDTLLKDAASS